MIKVKKLILPTTIAALMTAASVVPMQAHAAKAEFSFSGQISRAVSQVDNGIDTDTLHVDNNNSGTRLRLKGQTDLENGMTAGVYWETQYQDNDSSAVDIGDKDTSSAFKSRIREVWFSGDWGKLYLGQGNGAANGTSEVDFSGTTIADYSGNNLDDGISFVSKSSTTTVKNGDAFDNFDGLSRNDRLRYDLPKWGPVGLALSTGQERTEVALRYSSKFDAGGKLGIAAGFVTQDGFTSGSPAKVGIVGGVPAVIPAVAPVPNDFEQLGISASILFASGFNITVHVGEQDLESASVDPEGTWIKVGKITGQHNYSVSFHTVDDLDDVGDEAERTNLSYVYNMAKYGVELFGTFQTSSLDRTGVNFEDVEQFAIGSRIKF